MNSNSAKIIERFIEIGQNRHGSDHGWKKKFAQELGVNPAQMGDMLSGRSPIGPKMQLRLREIGADVDYILTGKRKEMQQIQYSMEGFHTPEEAAKYVEMIKRLNDLVSDDPDAIEKIITIVDMLNPKKK